MYYDYRKEWLFLHDRLLLLDEIFRNHRKTRKIKNSRILYFYVCMSVCVPVGMFVYTCCYFPVLNISTAFTILGCGHHRTDHFAVAAGDVGSFIPEIRRKYDMQRNLAALQNGTFSWFFYFFLFYYLVKLYVLKKN